MKNNKLIKVLLILTMISVVSIFAACKKDEPDAVTLSVDDITPQTVETSTAIIETTVAETAVPETIAPETAAPETVAPETDAPVDTSPKSWDLLNNQSLTPTTSGYPELDEGVQTVLSECTNDSMSTYQKVRAIYEFFVKNITYNRGLGEAPGSFAGSTDINSTPKEVLWAIDILNGRQGDCKNYAAGFTYLMRAIGLDAHMLTGQVVAYGGGHTPHTWTYIKLGGVDYTFDPDVDMNIYGRSSVWDTLFCRNMQEMLDTSYYIIEVYHEN